MQLYPAWVQSNSFGQNPLSELSSIEVTLYCNWKPWYLECGTTNRFQIIQHPVELQNEAGKIQGG